MSIFVLISLLAAVMTAFLGAFVLYRNPRGALNRIFFLYCLAGSIASFAEFEYRKAESFDTSLLWMQASALWIFSIPLELHFILRFTGRMKLLEKKLTYLLLYSPALVLSILWAIGLIPVQPVKTYWGWTYVRPEHGRLLDLLGAYAAAISIYELFLCARYYLREAEGKKKRQAGLILLGLLTMMILVVVTEPGLPFGSAKARIPRLTSLGFVAECIVVTLAIWKYELFSLSPTTAAGSIMETLTDVLLLVDPDGSIAAVNPSTLKLLGYRESELTHRPMAVVFPDQEASSFKGANSIHQTETVFVAKNGKEIPVSLSASVVRDEEGVEQGVVYVARDLTERKQAEAQIEKSLREKEILLREIHHRVKNNLQVISSLLMLQSEETTDTAAVKALKVSRNRVHSMAIIHETLYQSEYLAEIDLAECVRKLVDHLVRSYDVDPRNVITEVDVGQVSLNADLVIQCGLIINELVSNALKHAFPAGRTGKITVAMHLSQDNQVVLKVSDNGIGLPPDVSFPGAESLGLQLVDMLIQQLEGKVEVDRSGGTSFKIQFSA